MALPHTKDARLFYRSAKQRFEDSEFLFRGGRTTGAVYIAGYSIECILKALILSVVPAKKRPTMLESFRGARAHDYGWLKMRYFEFGGATFPTAFANHFTIINSWSTDWRYEPGSVNGRDAQVFLTAVREILNWAEERF